MGDEKKTPRFSVRSPARFVAGTDFTLWIQRVELYMKEAEIPDEKKGQELVSPLEDDAFRIVSQMGFLCADNVEYTAVKMCLQRQFSPAGVELEWQRRLHAAQQKSTESLTEFAGRLRMLADKAFPLWKANERLEMARNQFINGVVSSSIQLKLMQERPDTFDGAVTLACQLESIESAQRMLQTAKQVGTPSEDTTRGINAATASGNSSYQELAAQVTSLTQRLDSLLKPEHRTKYSRRVNCWHCRKPGHVRQNCPQLRAGNADNVKRDRSARHTSAVACTLTLKGAVEGYTTHMLVDTGSSVTLLHENVWKAAVRGQKQLSPAKYPVMAVNGESLVLSGQGDVLLKTWRQMKTFRVMLVCLNFAKDHGGVMVAHSVSPTYGGKTTIQLINPTPVPVTLYSQEKIGKLSFLQEADTVRLVEPSLDKKPKVRSEEAIRKTIDEMASKVQGLTGGEHTKFRSLLREFADVISVGDGDLGRTRVLRHKINTGDALPIHQQARRLPFHQRDMVQKMIKGMLEQGIIEPADGSWSSPIVLAKKKDGSFRFCVDYRRVNDVTKKDVHPIPRIDDALDTLAGAKWFSTIDLASGYWQVEMDPSDKEKTTFVTPFGLHQFRIMPFGLTNAPSTFQRLMGLVLAGLSWSTCLVYLDDIIVFSQTVEEHFTRLADVLRSLTEHLSWILMPARRVSVPSWHMKDTSKSLHSEATVAPSEMKKEESNDVTNSSTEAFQAMSSWVPVLPFFDQKREQQSDPDLTQVTAWIECHDSPSGSHLGMTKTLEKIRSSFYWPGQRKDVEDWCKGCEMCASRKSPSTKRRAPLQSDLTGCPLQRVAMDILGPLPLTDRGNKYVLVVGDYFTKWIEAYAMEAGTVAELFVSRFVCQFGVPDVLHTDQGRNFESALLKEVCQLLGVVKTRTTPYHPQSDDLVERFNRTLLNLLSMAASENERDWDLHIPMVNKYAQDMRFRMEQAYQLVRDPVPKGKSVKLHRYWQGPYKVIDVLGKVLFKIQHRDHPRKKCVIHFDRLKPYIHSSKRGEEQEVLPPQHSSNGEQEDDVEIEIVPGKRPDQRRNDLVDNEEVPVEPQEVVVEEDREVEQQLAAPGEEIVGDNEEIAEPIVAEGQPRRSTRSRRKPDKLGQNIYDV
eukprot:Em0015g808a